MKTLWTADWHLHNWRAYSTITKEGLNSRLQDQIRCLTGMVDWAASNEIEWIINLGDFFHAQGDFVSKDVLRAATVICELIQDAGIRHTVVPGNHDIYREKTIFRPFKHLIDIVTEPRTEVHSEISYSFIPWTLNRTRLQADIKKVSPQRILGSRFFVLGCHQLFKGARLPNFHITKKGDIDRKAVGGFDLVLSGHNHRHQKLGNIWYIGAPYQMDHGDEDDAKGFIIGTAKDFVFKHIDGPKFHTVICNDIETAREITGLFNPVDYFRISVKGDFEWRWPNSHRYNVIFDRRRQHAPRLDIVNDPIEDAVKKSIEHMDTDLDKGILYDLCMEVWNASN